MKYLATRWKNTFSGRSFLDGIKLLFKPAPMPTDVDSNIPPGKPPGKPPVNKQANNNKQ